MKITSLIHGNYVLFWSKNGQNSISTKLLLEMPKSQKCQYFTIPWALWTPHHAKIGGSPGRAQEVKFRSRNSYFLLVSSTSTFVYKTNEIINIFRNAEISLFAFSFKTNEITTILWFWDPLRSHLGPLFLFFSEILDITGDQWKMMIFWRYKYSKNVMFIERKSWFS